MTMAVATDADYLAIALAVRRQCPCPPPSRVRVPFLWRFLACSHVSALLRDDATVRHLLFARHERERWLRGEGLT